MVTIAPQRPVSGIRTAPVEPAPGPPSRDRVLDLVRVAAMVLVVAQHWLMPILAVDGGAIVLERANVLENVWPATWVTQVMPLVFFTSGAAAVLSLRGRAAPGSTWVARRLIRLLGGVVVLAVVWLPLPHALLATGLDPAVVSVGSRLIGALLWFLVVLVVLTMLTPVLLRMADRWRGVELGALALAAVGVDVVRFGAGWQYAGYLNAVLVWAAVYLVGVHYARGRLAWLSGARAVGVAALALAVLAAAVAFGPYPPAMIGLPGTSVSNMNPPSAALLALAAAQIGLLLALRPALERLVARPRVAALIDRCAPHTMTVYLWHTPAIVLVAAVVVALGVDAPEVGSATWGWQLPLWCIAAGAVLAMCVAGVGQAGLRPGHGRVGTGRVVGAGALALGGLAALMVGGFDPARWSELVGPWVGAGAIACGAALLGARLHADVPALRSRVPEPRLAGASMRAPGKVVA
ncbi:acyltransferase family protein [Pseudactinotalea sp.]|uniref:acyltransferase family protein n=1 Tax=Pseudactinotalea sp. TaxID=1926260 RepID=UPI003B3B6803